MRDTASNSQLHLQEALPNVLWLHIKGNDDSMISGETAVTQSVFPAPEQISAIFCFHCHHNCRFECVRVCMWGGGLWIPARCFMLMETRFCYQYINQIIGDTFSNHLGIVTITHVAENNESIIVQINLGTTRVLGSGSEKFSLLI